MDATLALALVLPLALLLVLAVWVARTYNRLVSLRNRTQEAWSGIDVQLQRRADLVPNLVSTVEGYRFHEQEVLQQVTAARAQMVRAAGPQASGEADDLLEAALTRLFAVAEDYPELRASENFLALQRELSGLEEEISFARRYYNALAERLNTGVESFPTVLVAGPLGFHRVEYFKAGPEATTVPETDFAV